ncbi:DNA-processing protein DprA [Mycoplasmopsis adleri]|uniref:DNA-processing protein DprA n=1 Tax=Mycoplasmopsis adleri TaxID=51362 RepID=UPI00387369DD
MNDILLYFSYIHKGNNYLIYKSIKNNEPVDNEKIEEIKALLKEKDIKTLTVFDKEYPEQLKHLKYAPFILYYQGNLDLLNYDLISMTGDIETENVVNNINTIVPNLMTKGVLVTNNYKNLDQKIIDIYRENNQKIIFILANGLTYEPFEIKKDTELVITQYPFDTHPKLIYFKERNVICSALAKCLIIYSSKRNSGIINLAMCFANMGKEVYCYPGLTYDDGNTFLIKSGANLMTHLGDVSYY